MGEDMTDTEFKIVPVPELTEEDRQKLIEDMLKGVRFVLPPNDGGDWMDHITLMAITHDGFTDEQGQKCKYEEGEYMVIGNGKGHITLVKESQALGIIQEYNAKLKKIQEATESIIKEPMKP